MGIHEIRSKLYGDIDYVCGGHGARRPSHGTYQMPPGITIKFYVRDTQGLPAIGNSGCVSSTASDK